MTGSPAPQSQNAKKFDPDTIEFRYLLAFAVAAILFGFILNTPREIWQGTRAILTSPSPLLTDYMAIANPGATFANAGLLMLVYVLYVRWHHDRFSGPLVAGLFTVFGFALFGKNLFNTPPITIGVFLWARLERKPSENYLVASLFGTALGPVVSYIAFAKGLPTVLGIIVGYVVGIVIGILIPPLAAAFMKFHHGLSLYNVGFVAGILGMVAVAMMNLFGSEVSEIREVSYGNNLPMAIFVLLLCSGFLILGIYYHGGTLRGYPQIFQRSGRAPSDFFTLEGLGTTFINMAILGIGTTLLVLAVGGTLNGPVLGGIFTVIGFAAFGKQPLNIAPIIVGVFIGAMIMGLPLGDTGVLLIVLFGTALAPMAGVYGPIAGVIAGFVHIALAVNVGILHGGLNLYNNGFAAGFVALILIPVFNAVYRMRGKVPPLVDA